MVTSVVVVASVAFVVPGFLALEAQQAGNPLGAPPLGLDLYVRIPPDSPPTADVIVLGESLFFDPLLSADGSISCASRHRPERGFADSSSTSQGVFGRRTSRNAPSLLNAGYGESFFWDGRIRTLEEQVLQPIINPNEMGLPLEDLVVRLDGTPAYRGAFAASFGEGPTPQTIGMALASYVRTLRSGNSPADRYASGDDVALGPDARAGFALFREKANCVGCHIGPLLSDERFHNTGVGWGSTDLGRFEVTGQSSDRGKFNTPSLRNVARTAPYMHDGSMETLEEVIELYDRGGNPNPNLDSRIAPLRLSPDEKKQTRPTPSEITIDLIRRHRHVLP